MLYKQGITIKNIFTIDTEDWFHANYEDNLFQNENTLISTIEANVEQYLSLFNKYNVKATFFVLGSVAENHPLLVKKIYNAGHEIASHGYGHQLVYKQTPTQFEEDVKKSKILCENLIGNPVYGYRAPSWSITDDSLWALDILERLEFKYCSSIFPTKNFLYGIPYAPRFQHNHSIYGKNDLKLIEIPPSTIGFPFSKINIPFSGGFYFRVIPYTVIHNFCRQINKEGNPVVFYLHPREIDLQQPRLSLNPKNYFIHYYGIKQCEKKLVKILKNYEFQTISEMLGISF